MCWTRFVPAVAAGVLILPSLPAAPVADDQVRSKVDARVSEWWLTADEKRFDQIGWAADIRTARKLAAEHDRPVFLFTMDGRVNTGRC
ncbi:MAG: hypothetical protein J2P46_07365 [Zavarzinella sp.]|nr:hypothetical protein [Zavarzinella sp.]